MDVFQAARIYIKSPDVRLFNIPSVFAGRRVDVKCVTLAEMGGNDRKSTHERTVQRVQGTWKVQQEGNISAYIYIRTTHASPRFALHHVPRLVSVQCLTTRPGYPLSAASLSLQPPYPSFLLPPLHWIRFSFFSPSIDRYHRVRSRRFVPLINFFPLDTPSKTWALLLPLPPLLPTIQLRPRLHIRNALVPTAPVDFPFNRIYGSHLLFVPPAARYNFICNHSPSVFALARLGSCAVSESARISFSISRGSEFVPGNWWIRPKKAKMALDSNFNLSKRILIPSDLSRAPRLSRLRYF